MSTPFFIYLADLLLAAAGAWLIMLQARRLGLVDRPNQRSSHQRPTPKGGGVGMLAAFLLTALWAGAPPMFTTAIAVAAGLGLASDLWDLAPKLRLMAYFGLAMLLVLETPAGSAPLAGPPRFLWWCFFIVGTANVYNFMDGIDGISALTGIVAFGLSAVFFGMAPGRESLVFLSLGLTWACAGFLPFNFPKARVFMGDVGAILLGFAFAGLITVGAESILDFVCLASFLFTYYADEISTMIPRLMRRENLLLPHRSHLYQLLANELGLGHWRVSLGFALFQLGVGIGAMALRPRGLGALLLFLAVCAALFGALSLLVRLAAARRTAPPA